MVSKFLYLSSSKAKWQESFKWQIRLQFLIHSSSLGRSFNFELFLFATMGIILYGHQIRERGCIWPWVNWVMPRSRQRGGSRTIRGQAVGFEIAQCQKHLSFSLSLCLTILGRATQGVGLKLHNSDITSPLPRADPISDPMFSVM